MDAHKPLNFATQACGVKTKTKNTGRQGGAKHVHLFLYKKCKKCLTSATQHFTLCFVHLRTSYLPGTSFSGRPVVSSRVHPVSPRLKKLDFYRALGSALPPATSPTFHYIFLFFHSRNSRFFQDGKRQQINAPFPGTRTNDLPSTGTSVPPAEPPSRGEARRTHTKKNVGGLRPLHERVETSNKKKKKNEDGNERSQSTHTL